MHLYDIAPTLLALMGLPTAENMSGRVASELFQESFWRENPVGSITTYEGVDVSVSDWEDVEIDARTIQHLCALGY